VGPDPADLDLVRGLVEIPSVSRREGEAVEWLVLRMGERGFRAIVDDAGNAVGEIGGGPFHVVLLGHIDTVPGEIDVRIEGDELVGRGAVDAKGPLAAFVAAATKPVPGVRVTVVGAVEEESPTSKGARHRATLAAPDWCVIGEPSGWDAVTVAYKGRLTLEERVRASRGERGGAERASERLDCRLESIDTGSGDGLFERARLRIGYRVPPGMDSGDLERAASDLAQSDGDTTVVVTTQGKEEPVRTARTSPLARAFARAIVAAGGQTTFKEKSGTSDMNVLFPAWGCPMVAYGPGDSRYDHTPIERLSIRDFARSISVLRGVLSRASDRII